LVVAALSAPSVASAIAPTSDTEAELKARFRERQEVLNRLKDAGKIGETSQGLVDVVRDAYRQDGVTLPGGATTVAGLVGTENADRQRLYRLIGERTDEPATAVAQQAALRNFRQASPNHYLKLQSGKWVKKQELPEQ
jgi:uncharacterized protein YdbL (DUF1318 family)